MTLINNYIHSFLCGVIIYPRPKEKGCVAKRLTNKDVDKQSHPIVKAYVIIHLHAITKAGLCNL